MKQNEKIAVALGDDAAVLYECSNDEKKPSPRLTIHNAIYRDEGGIFPASSVVVFGSAVYELYEALHKYYTDNLYNRSTRA